MFRVTLMYHVVPPLRPGPSGPARAARPERPGPSGPARAGRVLSRARYGALMVSGLL
jgi:hypothetical protein